MMTFARSQSYLFSTEAQWEACLFAGADRETATARTGLHPQAPFARNARSIASAGAFAPAQTPAGEILWRDAGGHLLRALPGDETAESFAAPWAIAQASRVVVTHDAIWVAGADAGTLECFELDGLTRRRVLSIAGARVIDLAADERNSVLVLALRNERYELVHVGCGGGLTTLAVLDVLLKPTQLASLPAHSRILLLDQQGTRLVGLIRGQSLPAWTRQLATFRPCFTANALGSDGRGRVFVTGADGDHFGGTPHAIVLDPDATLIDIVQLDSPATGVAGGRGSLIVSQAGGISVYGAAASAGDSAPVSAEFVTPLLRAPDTGAELKWQRVDCWATLPEGTTLELRYGWTDDAELAARASKLLADERLPQSQRLTWLRESLNHWSAPISLPGNAQREKPDATAPPLSFPLHDARAGEIWVHVSLRATPRSALPALTRMSVSYAGSALLDQLPAIYRRTAVQPGDFLGALIGTLEATTQDLDRRIASLGSLVHPDTAPTRWLDELAEWLGLPWDDALTPAQKRAIVGNAAELAAHRGTRRGLAALLASLFPGTPPRFRISDVDVDFGFAALGGAHCRGSALPAVLAGLPHSAAVLSRKTILGKARLPCNGAMPSATAELSGQLRIDITASPAARRTAEPWLARLADSMVPANLRVDLRWQVPSRDTGPDGEWLLMPAPYPHLGADAITGFARLPGGPASALWS